MSLILAGRLARMTALCLCLVVPVASHSEIEKHGALTDSGMKLFWWPKLQAPKGWAHDSNLSEQMKMNLLLPRGKTFDNAPTVIYARAFYEPDKKKRGSLREFIEGDIAEMKQQGGDLVVKQLSPMKTASGKPLVTYSMVREGKTYERIAYGAEGDYWILFVASSQTQAALAKDLPAFEKVVAAYK